MVFVCVAPKGMVSVCGVAPVGMVFVCVAPKGMVFVCVAPKGMVFVCVALKGMVFAPFWSENRYIFPFLVWNWVWFFGETTGVLSFQV